MWLSKLSVQNFRSFESADIEFSKGINILTGANNSGKSSILLSILALQQMDQYIKLEDVRKKSKSLNISYQLVDMPDKYFNQFGISKIDIGRAKGQSSQKAQLDIGNNPNETKTLKSYKIQLSHIENGRFALLRDYNISGESQEVPFFSDEEPMNFIYPFLSRRKVKSYAPDVSSRHTKKVMKDLENLPARIDSTLYPGLPQFDEYRKYCEEVLGILIAPFSDPTGKNVGYSFGRGDEISINSMGEGSTIAGLLANLCLAKEGCLFVIEEPENDLHPAALKRLLAIIKEKSEKHQFIISTHSHIVTKYLGSVIDSKIFETVMNIDNNKIPTTKVSELKTPEERLNSLEALGYEFTDFGLPEGWLLLEESSAQRIIESILIPKFIPELSNKIRIISAGGISKVEDKFKALENHFLYIHLDKNIYLNKAWVIVDSGDEENKLIEKMKDTYSRNGSKLWEENHFQNWTEHDFEKYYPAVFNKEIDEIITMKRGEEKKGLKKVLLGKVINWCSENSEEAEKQFAESAKEVIDKLKSISKELRLS